MYEFWQDLGGKEHSDLKARKHHFERALANGDTVEGLSHKIKDTGQRTFKARSRVAMGAAGLAAAGVYGVKKYSDHQTEVAHRNLTSLYELQKRASVARKVLGKAKAATTVVAKTGVKAVKKVVNTGLDFMNTAHGGKIKQFALDNVKSKHIPNFSKFVGASREGRTAFVSGDKLEKLKKLDRKSVV